MSVFTWFIRALVVASFLTGITMFFHWRKNNQENNLGRPFTTSTIAPRVFNHTDIRLKVEAEALHYKKCIEWFFWKEQNKTDEQFPVYYAISMPECVNRLVFKNVIVVPHQSKQTRLVHVYPPKSDNEPSIFVEIGWTKDIHLEKNIRSRTSENSELLIADPALPPENKTSWENIATFYDLSITAGKNVKNSAEQQSSSPSMDIVAFIIQTVRLRVVDQLAVNTAESSATIFPLLLREGPLDKNSIVVCQWNFKINADNYAQITPILKELTKENRYVPIRILIAKGYLQFFFINVEKFYCVDRYLSQYF